MKRSLACLAVLLAFVPLTASTYITGVDAIRNRGEIVFAATGGDNFPYLYREGTVWKGMDIAYLDKIAGSIGVPWRILSLPSIKACMESLETGRADALVSGCFANSIDAVYLAFSDPCRAIPSYLLVDRLAFAQNGVKDPSRIIERLKEKKGALIGIGRRSSVNYRPGNFGRAEIRVYDDQKDGLRDLLRGELQACVLEESEYNRFCAVNSERLLYFRPVLLKDCEEDVCFAVYWGNRDLLNIINLILGGTN